MITETEMVLRIGIACVLGGIVGIERESLNRPAGFRTHIMVCSGSTLIMLVSMYGFPGTWADPSRIAAQVVTGIGFLGAGTIMQQGGNIRGLTTAASIWVIAGVGLAVGTGMYVAAIATSILSLIVLRYSKGLERALISKRKIRIISVTIQDYPGQLGELCVRIGQLGIDINNVEMHPLNNGKITIELNVQFPANKDINDLMAILAEMQGVERVEHS